MKKPFLTPSATNPLTAKILGENSIAAARRENSIEFRFAQLLTGRDDLRRKMRIVMTPENRSEIDALLARFEAEISALGVPEFRTATDGTEIFTLRAADPKRERFSKLLDRREARNAAEQRRSDWLDASVKKQRWLDSLPDDDYFREVDAMWNRVAPRTQP